MPTTLNFTIDALRRLAVATLAYAVAIAVVAGCMLPTLLHSQPMAGLLPKPPPIVARSPAPSLRAAL
jgi:hypothetical protein